MRFHLIDRVDAYEPSKSVRGRKLTSRFEEYWDETPDGPVMPPPLALEALCQAGTWLIMISTERRKRAALLSVGAVDFLGPIVPGDVLELEGFSPICVAHPAELRNLDPTVEPELFLIDLMLPGISGIELAQQLRAGRFATTPMIAMSASNLMLDTARNMSVFQDTLAKPFDLQVVIDAVERHVQSSATGRRG